MIDDLRRSRAVAREALAEAQRRLADDTREVEKWKTILAELGDGVVADDIDLDFDPANVIAPCEAAYRFSKDEKTIRVWCREKGIGKLRGGRWDVSVPRLQRHLNTTTSVD